MSTNPNPSQCLQDAIAHIHHELRTRTWFSIHELLGDDGQEYKTLNLRHHLGLDVHASVARGMRAPYKKRKAGEINATPPPHAIRARPPAVTDQASDLTLALQEANKANNTKTSSKLLGPATRSSYCLLGAKARVLKPTRIKSIVVSPAG
jgi:hypothetical protein